MHGTLLGLVVVLTTLTSVMAPEARAGARLINGKPVTPGTYKEVVRIRSDGAGCTATVVGPRVIITAAHCAKTGGTATFEVAGKQYSATITRSSLYPGQDHDVALGVTTQDITGVEPASIGGTATQGLGITLLGYGCINPGGGGGNDGVLRIGESTIVEFSGFDMVSRKAGGAALCFGDSGGPAFVTVSGKKFLLGINSKGNIQDTNYNARLDIQQSKTFLQNYAQQNGVQICGVNKDCTGDPLPGAPSCTLAVSPSTFKKGETATASLSSTGQVTSARINGQNVTFPTGTLPISGTTVGTFSALGEVTGPGGTGRCSASYTVEDGVIPDPPPTCTLTAVPSVVVLGRDVSLEINVSGKATSATIEGTFVSIPNGKKLVRPNVVGNFTASAQVAGPGGSNTCATTYEVINDDPGPDPTAPNFSIVPSYCGDNILAATDISRVCLAVVKKDASIVGLRVTHALQITYRSGSKEVLPIIATASQGKNGSGSFKEELTLFTNQLVAAGNHLVMDTRKAVLTKLSVNGRDIPTAVEGRTSTGKYFIVEQLKLPGLFQLPEETTFFGWWN